MYLCSSWVLGVGRSEGGGDPIINGSGRARYDRRREK